MSKLEIATLIESISKSKQKLKQIKDKSIKNLIEAIVLAKAQKQVIKELTK